MATHKIQTASGIVRTSTQSPYVLIEEREGHAPIVIKRSASVATLRVVRRRLGFRAGVSREIFRVEDGERLRF